MNEDAELCFCLVITTELVEANDLRGLSVHCCQKLTVDEAQKVKIDFE